MLDRLNLEEMRTKGTYWKHRRGALRALWITVGILFVLIIATQFSEVPPSLNPAQQRVQSTFSFILWFGFLSFLVVVLSPIIAYNRINARLKAQIAASLSTHYPEFIDPKSAKDFPSYAKSAASLNGGKDGKTLLQSLMSHDYASAQAIIEQNKDEFPYPDMTVPQAVLHHILGEYDQADALYWRLLAGSMRRGSPVYVAMTLSNLADTRLERDQLSEALTLIEHAITISPNYYHPYLVLCEYYLNLPGNPHAARAMQWAEVARDVLPTPAQKPDNQYFQHVNAVYALALANVGELDRAKTVITELMPYIDPLSDTSPESVFKIGCVFEIIGETSSARSVFEKVAAQSSQGRLGKKAAERLAQLNVEKT